MTKEQKGRHSNRYRYWYDKIYTKEEIKDYFHEGWHDLIESSFELVSHFPDAQICSAKRCMGMLHMFAKAEDEMVMHAVEGVLWKIERLSSKICEKCGQSGQRRTELKAVHCLCNDCLDEYVKDYSTVVQVPQSLNYSMCVK